MANELQVYSFEANFLEALKTLLADSGLQVVTFGDPDRETSPRLEINFNITGVDNMAQGRTSEGKPYLRRYQGTYALQIYTVVKGSDSAAEKAAHLAEVGRVRNQMSYLAPILKAPTLPYYEVKQVFEQTSQNGLAVEEDSEIVTGLNFNVTFEIPPSAFDA